jgi:uncharacterized protein YjbI with pentapeptide repeats
VVLDGYARSWFIVDSPTFVIVSVIVAEKDRQTAGETKGRKPWTLRKFGGKTYWDWLHLLSALAIPVLLAIFGFWFTAKQDARQQAIDSQQQSIENQRAQLDALQAYLNQIGTLLLDEGLRTSEVDEKVRDLARARTLTLLDMLSPERKPRVLAYLFEMELIQTTPPCQGEPQGEPIISLKFADLQEVHLVKRHLLKSADLVQAELSKANLSGANLCDADLHKADLSGADLSDADLTDADISGADLSNADLTGADITREQLDQAASLKGTKLSRWSLLF